MKTDQVETAIKKRSKRRGTPVEIDIPSVVQRLRKTYQARDSRPSDVEVRNHSVKFAPVKWAERWASLPSTTHLPLVLVEPALTLEQSRQDLFDAARAVKTEDDAVDLYVRVSGWGVGNSARGRFRALTALEDPEAPRKLLEAARAARRGGPVELFSRLAWGGDLKIKGYGPAFYTKWMYFNGYEESAGNRPLILDQRVARALGIGVGYRWSRASSYQAYLGAVPQIRDQWMPGASDHVIEHSLFEACKR